MGDSPAHDDLGPADRASWPAIRSKLAQEARDSISEFDVARLRRSVGARLASERVGSARRGRVLAGLSSVAALAAFAALLIVFRGGYAPDQRVSGDFVDPAARVSLSLGEDGQVVFRFHDGRPIHKIRKGMSPVIDREATVVVARGSEYVDRNGLPVPGQVTFYEID